MRLVLDTNVVASALLWGGTPRLLLEAGRIKRVELFTSTQLLGELTDVPARQKFAGKIAASSLSIDELIDRYTLVAALVHVLPTPRIATDPDDDVVIGTALAARAEVIVTGDRPFQSLVQHQGVRILSVRQVVEMIGA